MDRVAIMGFGEAGRAFAGADGWAAETRAFDVKLLDPAARPGFEAAAAQAGVALADGAAGAVERADAVLSLVTADQALTAAEAAAPHLAAQALFLDMNSVSPATKRRAAAAVEAAGGRYADVAVMAPVHPRRLSVPLLVAGPHAAAAGAALAAMGFTRVAMAGGEVGRASAVKMIRSVVVKGVEALTAECLLAAEAAGVRAEVLASLDAGERAGTWAERGDYHLDRMMVHGLRRAEEMGEVVATLDGLGVGSAMSRATAERQRAIGALRLAPPHGLDAKLRALASPPAMEDAA